MPSHPRRLQNRFGGNFVILPLYAMIRKMSPLQGYMFFLHDSQGSLAPLGLLSPWAYTFRPIRAIGAKCKALLFED